MQPGDLVFYYHPVSHVGIYAGDGKFINAPRVRRRRALPERLPLGLLRRSPPVVPARPRPLPRGSAADPAWSAAALGTVVGTAAASVRCVARTLLVTNDFPPRTGGIQRYLLELATRLPDGELVVYAPAWPGRGSVRRPAAVPGAPAPDLADGARADGPAAGRPDRPRARGRHRVVRRRRPAGPARASACGARPTSCGCSRAATATRSGGRCCPAPGRPCATSDARRRRHHRLPLHPRPGRRRVRADGRAGTPPARHRRRPVPARSRAPAPRCAAGTASATRPSSPASLGSWRARARTC